MTIETMNLQAIKDYFNQLDHEAALALLPKLLNDERKGVRNFGQSLLKKEARAAQETARIEAMWQFERQMKAEGFHLICGTDEAGRGPLAGPVVAAAVILPEGIYLEKINDSKKLTETMREALFEKIIEGAVSYAIAEVDNVEIDRLNILRASQLAMQKAVAQLSPRADCVLLDGLDNPMISLPHLPIVKGDSKSISIAAASILAKVHRDRLMLDYDKQYPQYHFAQHKGYPTESHYAALRQYGPSAIHRMSFNLKLS